MPEISNCMSAKSVDLHCLNIITSTNKKSELMLMRRARARACSSSCLQVILVYLHPFHCIPLFCSQNSPKNH